MSTTDSIFHCTWSDSASACRSTSSLPPLTKLSRAPAFEKPICRVVPSKPMTWAFWLSRIQVNRRRFLTASRMSGHICRTWAAPCADPGAGADAAASGAGADSCGPG
ncbi:hypothetical protein GTY57_01490, partial [Streptomyces sp. SID5475]|nr:hypothetical protein [Streptomyces sp. SID5475]